ncbi:von Willebrand factor A domain-containing protein 5A-like isoform X1, partial [Lates japonicus]
SSFTAFIAVNKGNNELIQGPLVRRDVPTASCQYLRCYSLTFDQDSEYGDIDDVTLKGCSLDDPCDNVNVSSGTGSSFGSRTLSMNRVTLKGCSLDDPCDNVNVFSGTGTSLGPSTSSKDGGKSAKKRVKSVFSRIGSYLKGQSASPQSNSK